MAFSSVDLPTFGRPKMATVPAIWMASFGVDSSFGVAFDTGGLV
jgi:hypothetical protein